MSIGESRKYREHWKVLSGDISNVSDAELWWRANEVYSEKPYQRVLECPKAYPRQQEVTR